MKKINYCIIDNDYWKQISNYDKKIPSYENYISKDEYKPFFQTLFNVGDLCYVACLSKKKKKHYKMSPYLDFLKVYIETSNKKPKHASKDTLSNKKRFFISVVNLNNMFPVPKSLIKNLDFKDIDQYKKFETEEEKGKYITLLKKEAKSLEKLNIQKKAEKLYDIVCNYGDQEENKNLVDRCVDFKKAEQFALSYIKK